MTDETRWPEGFCDIGNKTFLWVKNNKADWVDFTLKEMDNPTGLFLQWKEYLQNNKDAESKKNGPISFKASKNA